MDKLATLGSLFPGSRIGVLLVHGLTGTPTEMTTIAKDLNKYGFTVFCPLLAGHCASEEELIKTAWPDWADSVKTALGRFLEHVDVVFAGGISAGAVLSLHLAQVCPGRLRGLALYSTTLQWDGWSIPKSRVLLPIVLRLPVIGTRFRFEEAYPYGLKNEKMRNRIQALMVSGDAAAAGFSGTPGRAVKELWRMVDAVKKRLPEILTPTLLIHASNDDIASMKKNAVYIQKRIGGPTKLVPLDNSYHMITIDQERHKVSAETAEYFALQLSDQEKEELSAHALPRRPRP